ncbi:MAG TPA: CHAT domain-containing protein [Lapillicoccus sp.]|nr:CHAT domain-containing protein [Lapillicoccus sp.]
MGGKAVVDFDLTIEAHGDGVYRATVDASPVGRGASATFRIPSEIGIEGSGVADAVLTGAVGDAWQASVAAVASTGRRLRLRLPDAPTEVPWELMVAGDLDATTVRLTSCSARAPMRLDGPLRAVMVGWGGDDLHTELRWVALQNAVEPLVHNGTVVVDRLFDRSPRALFDWMRRHDVHILHVVDGDPAAPYLAALVSDHDALRAVLLDRIGPPGWVGPAVTKQAVDLAGRGCPGVAAMSLTSTTSATFRGFYLALVSGVSFDVAAACLPTPVVAVGLSDAIPLNLGVARPRTLPSATDSGTIPGPSTSAPPRPSPSDAGAAVAPPPATQVEPPPPVGSARGGRSAWRSMREAIGDLLGGLTSSTTRRRPSPSHPAPGPPADRTAYPLIEARIGRHGRANVVVVDEPFDVTLGLTRYQDTTLSQTAGLRFATPRVELELVLTFDPTSLHTDGPTRIPLTVTDDDPYPSARLRFTARYRPDLPPVRRLGVQFVRDGQVVAVAWRHLVVVLHRDAVAGAVVPVTERDPLLDLGPLLGADLPDLVLTICASDGAASGEFVWTAYARSPQVVVPDAPRISLLDNELREFMTAMRAEAAGATDPYSAYLALVGKAMKVGRAVPPGIASVIREVVADPRRRDAATVLLLTEELSLPWELAALDPPLDTRWGGISPVLGAHAAISRWPLTQHRPRPTPRSSVTVRKAAVLAADYTGVAGWNRLDHALVEAQQVAALFTPPVVTVPPLFPDVVQVLRGVPPADLLHVALHGQFDAVGSQEGLVLLGAQGPVRTAQFLTPDQVETGRLDGAPFVFLNACQVAADKRVLADYGGFASTLLRIGATGVVAPLWNVDDDVAATFAQDFYAATWTGAGASSVAEAVRAQRARYTEAAAEAHTPGITPTLIAFQVFGHPRLRLTHV